MQADDYDAGVFGNACLVFSRFFYLPMEVFIKVTNSLVMTRDNRFLCVWMLFYVNNFCQFVNEDAKILTDG